MCKQHRLAAAEPPGRFARRSAAAARTAGCGACGRTGLQAADIDDLLSGPDPKRKGAGATAENGEGAIVQQLEWQNGVAAADPDYAGGVELSRQLAGQVETGTGITPGQRKSRSI